MLLDEFELSQSFVYDYGGTVDDSGIHHNHTTFRLVPHWAKTKWVALVNINVDVDKRSQGCGSKTLANLSLFLDSKKLICHLVPEPYDNSPLTLRKLKQWYKKHGFKINKQGMTRK